MGPGLVTMLYLDLSNSFICGFLFKCSLAMVTGMQIGQEWGRQNDKAKNETFENSLAPDIS